MDAAGGGALACERPGPGSPFVNVQESAARYAFAATAARCARVLDVASGNGLGSELLLRSGARFVVGVEADAGAVVGAACGPSFVRADATALPFRDGCYDLVVSFETIEHVADANRMVAECRRVLRRGGCLYLSTPNRRVTSWLPPNPFHVREFTTREMIALVRRHFDHVSCHWQRPVALPVFVLRQLLRRALRRAPGGQAIWRRWERLRPERTRRGAALWHGEHFDDELLADPHYRVVPARPLGWQRPTYTVLVARC